MRRYNALNTNRLFVAAMAIESSRGCQLEWRIFLLKSILSASSWVMPFFEGAGERPRPALFLRSFDFLALNADLSACRRIALSDSDGELG